jgi:hypothetical protein
MLSSHPTINDLFDRYFTCPEKPFAKDHYLEAVMHLNRMYVCVDEEVEVLLQVIDCVLDRYEELESKIERFAQSQNYDEIIRASECLLTQMQSTDVFSKIQMALDLKLASQARDYARTYSAWLKLHTRLSPLLSVLKRFRETIADTSDTALMQTNPI